MLVHLAPFLINAARMQTVSVMIYAQVDSGFCVGVLLI